MAVALKIHIANGDEVARRFGKRSDKVKKLTEDIITDSIFVLEKHLKIASPVRTGRMRASITEGKQFGKTFGSIGPTVDYAKYVNRRRRFIEKGVNASRRDIVTVIKKLVGIALK